MGTQDTINLIKDSFETWYNKNISKNSPVSIAINYKDVQTLSIKAYHTISMEVSVIGIKDGKSFTDKIISLQENYNHGITTEEEAKEGLTKKMLVEMFGYVN